MEPQRDSNQSPFSQLSNQIYGSPTKKKHSDRDDSAEILRNHGFKELSANKIFEKVKSGDNLQRKFSDNIAIKNTQERKLSPSFEGEAENVNNQVQNSASVWAKNNWMSKSSVNLIDYSA